MGLGPIELVSLAEARQAAVAARKLLLAGVDPIEARLAGQQQAALDSARAMTFRQCAEAYIEAHRPGWRNARHAAQWPNTLSAFVYPLIGELPVAAVDVGLVLKALEPIWTTKPETAGRVRGRIELVLDWARARGYRSGENPARWRGHLDQLLPAQGRVRTVRHHAALPYADLPEFMAELRGIEGIAPRALEFLILAAARSGEVAGARRPEIDVAAATWTIPAHRMKGNRLHRVPLADRALAILDGLPREADFVFPGARPKAPMSHTAMLETLHRMGRAGLTVHGFRSTFRDWAAEQTAYPREVAEMALAHAVGDKVEAAYRRGDLFEKRRRLMVAWAGYCGSPARQRGSVTTLQGGA